MYQPDRAARPGPLRRLFAAIAARCQLTTADMPERSPLEAGTWEHAPTTGLTEFAMPTTAPVLPQVALPRQSSAAKTATLPVAQPATTVR